MVDRPHFRLYPVESSPARRPRRRPPPLPDAHSATHGQHLLDQLAAIALRRQEEESGDEAIFRVNLQGKANLDDQNWERAEIRLLSEEGDHALIAFAPDSSMTNLRQRAALYQAGPYPGRDNAPYDGFFKSIEGFEEITLAERIGPRLRADGFVEPFGFPDDEMFWVDVRLWSQPNQTAADDAARAMRRDFQQMQEEASDQLITPDITLFRIRVSGVHLRQITELSRVELVDRPPQPDRSAADLVDTPLGAIDAIRAPLEDAPAITVLDSGLAGGHPLIATALGEATSLLAADSSAADDTGHGTFVAGIALYGDVLSAIAEGTFQPAATIYSGRVLNAENRFEDDKLVPRQMSDAIRYFRREYGCRIFNISLGDLSRPYLGTGKTGPWAAVLDALARELDVLIVVAAGNHRPQDRMELTQVLARYPRYLLDDDASVLEPSNGANVLTVGSLSNSDALPVLQAAVPHVQPIAAPFEPSPFTRSGPAQGRMKPDVCEVGGNAAFDGALQEITSPPAMRIVSLSHQPIQQLFATRVGTSHAAPRVANQAARILTEYPDASANLVRAFLAASADIPIAAANRLSPLGPDAIQRVCGHGRPNPLNAVESSLNRVWTFSDRTIGMDEFEIYEVPIPDEWYETKGRRTLRVTLAYDPPVRESRNDYIGCRMNFWISQRSLEELQEAFAPFEPGDRDDNADEAEQSDPQRQQHGDRLTPSLVSTAMLPGLQTRARTTLQRAEKTWSNRELAQHRPWYLIVKAERLWASPNERQRYAVVLEMTHEAAVDLYTVVEQRVTLRERVRVRV